MSVNLQPSLVFCFSLFLLPLWWEQPDGEDDLKKRQLMELAIINGTYRDTTKPSTAMPQGPVSSRKLQRRLPNPFLQHILCAVLASTFPLFSFTIFFPQCLFFFFIGEAFLSLF
jgi:hypothetical protein